MIAQAGLQCGFGEALGVETLEAVRARGFTIVRIDVQACDQEKTARLAQEVLDAGLQPLCIIRRAEQMAALPTGTLVELGNEPDLAHFGWTVESYLAEARKCVEIAQRTDQRLYLGVVSNLNERGFRFLRRLPWSEWPEMICCSIHRYPDGHSPTNAHKGCKNREDEINKLRAIVGARPLAVTEVGYHDGRGRGWSEADVAELMTWERRFFSAQGFELVVAFQINDGAADNLSTEAHFGFRRLDRTWKPVASAFVNAV